MQILAHRYRYRCSCRYSDTEILRCTWTSANFVCLFAFGAAWVEEYSTPCLADCPNPFPRTSSHGPLCVGVCECSSVCDISAAGHAIRQRLSHAQQLAAIFAQFELGFYGQEPQAPKIALRNELSFNFRDSRFCHKLYGLKHFEFQFDFGFL